MLSRKPIEPGQIFYIIKQGFDFIQSVSQSASQPASQPVSQSVSQKFLEIRVKTYEGI